MKRINLILKRLIDFFGSLIGMIVISPLIIIVCLTIKFTSKGPIFFRQERLGKDGKVFKIFKFRTMVVNAESMGDGLTVRSETDSRITNIGKILRKTSLDELPQLLNVVAGQMSLVGPRPPVTYFPYNGINLILIITVPATVGLIVLVTPIVEIAFQRGAFDAVATLMTSQALIFYSVGLVAMALNLLLTRVYYSLQDTKTPMINGAISVAFNIVLNIILVKYMAHAGLALATSIATSISTLLLFYSLKKKIGSLGTKAYINTFLKTGLASGVMGVVAYLIYHGLYGVLGVYKLYNLISLLVAVGLGAIVYGVLCYLFRVEEVRDLVDKIIVRVRG